jgi:hypothetical protein
MSNDGASPEQIEEIIEDIRKAEKYYRDWGRKDGNVFHDGHADGLDHAIQRICVHLEIAYQDTK